MEPFVICLTFSRLAAKLSEMITKFQGCSLKIQHWLSFDLNHLKNSPSFNFKNSLKSMHLFQRLMGGMNCRYRDRTKTKCPKQWGVKSKQLNSYTYGVYFSQPHTYVVFSPLFFHYFITLIWKQAGMWDMFIPKASTI